MKTSLLIVSLFQFLMTFNTYAEEKFDCIIPGDPVAQTPLSLVQMRMEIALISINTDLYSSEA